MKQRILALFSALLIVFALVPPTSARAYSLSDYDATPFIENGRFDLEGYISSLRFKKLPYICFKYNVLETNDKHIDYNKKVPFYTILYPNTFGSTLIKTGTTFTSSSGNLNYSVGSYSANNMYIPMRDYFVYNNAGAGVPPAFGQPLGDDTLIDWYNADGADLGHNDYVPPVPLEEINVKDFKINTLRINKPDISTVLNGGIPEILQNVTFECEAKVSLPSSLNGDFPKILEYGNQFKQEVCDSIIYNYCGLSGTSAMPTVELYGKPYDWNSNGFITFKVKGTFQINTWDISSSTKSGDFTIGFNLQNDYRATRLSTSTYTWLSATNKVNLTYSVDVDGDNIDDVTNEPLPSVPILDNDGDGVADDTDGSGVTDFFGTFTESIKSIPSFTTEIANAYNGILGFLPQPIPLLITGALFTMIFVTVISFIRGN